MRKLLITLSVLAVLAIAVSTAIAQNQITLGGSTNSMTFTSTGSTTWSLSLPSGGLTGSANGTGTLLSGPDPYTITQGSGVTIKGTETSPTSNLWNISQSGALGFCYDGCGSGSLLTGNLSLLDLSQSSTGASGTFNDALKANLALTGGTLEKFFGSNAVLSISIDFAAPVSLSGLATGASLGATISSAELYPTTTPEPASMVLVGSGLLLLGGLVRRRRTAR